MDRLVSVYSFAVIASVITSNASATLLFEDQFNRANNETVGNGWLEINKETADVAIYNNALRLRGEIGTAPDAAVSQLNINTMGYENIFVSYAWAPLTASEASDTLYSAWRISGTDIWTTLLTHTLGDEGVFTDAIVGLGGVASNTFIDLRLWTDVSNYDEGARINYVTVTGTAIPKVTPPMGRSAAIPEPTSLALLTIGLLGMGALRHHRVRN